jgi:hypothetical protein
VPDRLELPSAFLAFLPTWLAIACWRSGDE